MCVCVCVGRGVLKTQNFGAKHGSTGSRLHLVLWLSGARCGPQTLQMFPMMPHVNCWNEDVDLGHRGYICQRGSARRQQPLSLCVCLPTYCCVLKVIEAVVGQDEPAPLPRLHPATCTENHSACDSR